MNSPKSKSLPWDIVEKAIYKEIKWLKETILESPFVEDEKVCKNCIYRNIAILMLTGKIKVKELKSSVSLFGRKKTFLIRKTHGKEEHSGLMKLIATYFKTLGYDVIIEPNVSMGRADLGIYRGGKRNLFVEVGTTSISKLLINLMTMKDSDILLVLDSNHAVEFSILDIDTSLADSFSKYKGKIAF